MSSPPYRYGCPLRPPSFAAPKGWTLVERGTAGSYPLRTDLPPGAYRHGAIEYDRPLTAEEIDHFELVPIP